MKKILIIQLLLLLVCGSIFAQKDATFTIQGVVLDPALNNEPLIGVSIYLKDRPGVGTTTDIDGKFSIKASRGDILIFSYLGYENYEQLVTKEEKNLKVELKSSSVQLDEAVIVGSMGTQRKISVVGAITSVDVAQLQTPATTLNNMLGGRVAGVISMQTSGEPGKNISEFWIRGIGTFGANASALVLIDGLEGTLSNVDPADVESFSVLKDASATAVYGVRGANGVVLVTTKRGTTDKLRITARVNFTVSQLRRLPEYLGASDYAQLANEARVSSGLPAVYSPMELDLIKYQLDPDLYPDVNWQKEIMNKTSLQHTYYLSAQGGGSIARYFISLNLSNEGSAYKQDKNSKYKANVGYNTYGYRSNLDINLTKTTTIYLGLDGFVSSRNEPGMANTNNLWSAQSRLTPLTIPKMYSNGMMPAYGPGASYSPYIMLNHTGTSVSQEYKNMVTLSLNQDLSMLLKGLKIKAQGALNNDVAFGEVRYILPEMHAAIGRMANGDLQMVKRVDAQAASYGRTLNHWRKYHFEATANYETLVADDHRFTGLVYYYMSDEKGTKDVTTSMQAIPKRYQGISSRITYGLKDTYFIDGNFGYTGSENFQPGKQFGFFPSAAIGWVPSNYKFISDNLPWLNFLKLRFSYGSVGNDRISDTRFPYLTLINSEAGSTWGGNMWGITETVVGADNLQWERAVKSDIGIEGRLFKEKLTFTVDYFNDQRNGIFQQRTQIPDFIGTITMPFGNVGRMRSYGSDGNLTFSHQINKNLSFTIRGNYTYSTNDVQSWEQAAPKYAYQEIQGRPYNILRGYISLGLFKDDLDVASSPKQFGTVRAGDIKYKDVNADGKINDDDKVPLAYSPFPRLMYGFGGEVKYKDFTLGIMFKGTGRTDFFHTEYNDGYGTYEMGYVPFHGGIEGNVLSIVKDQANRWTSAAYSGDPSTENPNARFPRLTYGKNENNTKLSTFWQDDSRYLRLSELSLNYNLKATKGLKQIGVSSIDFQLIGYNIAVWDKVKLFDPEQAYKNGAAYPIPTRYAFQLYLNF